MAGHCERWEGLAHVIDSTVRADVLEFPGSHPTPSVVPQRPHICGHLNKQAAYPSVASSLLYRVVVIDEVGDRSYADVFMGQWRVMVMCAVREGTGIARECIGGEVIV